MKLLTVIYVLPGVSMFIFLLLTSHKSYISNLYEIFTGDVFLDREVLGGGLHSAGDFQKLSRTSLFRNTSPCKNFIKI